MFILDNIWGISWAMRSMRLAYKSKGDTPFDSEKIGAKDYELALRLIKSGSSHSKFLRCIVVWATVRGPRMWWRQWDAYNFVVNLSESTHHTILRKELTQEDFVEAIPEQILDRLNFLRSHSVRSGDENWRQMKVLLPEGFMQVRGVVTNYQTLRTMYHQRKQDPLHEWRMFEKWVLSLPYSEFITDDTDNGE